MSYGNRVKETSTTTGVGNITTAGAVIGFVTFNTAFGLNRPFHYIILHDTDNTWEIGIGHLTASTTFVRDIIIDNSSGTTSAISFASGGLTLIASPTTGSLFNSPAYAFQDGGGAGGQFLRNATEEFASTGAETQVADRIVGIRWITFVGMDVNQAQIECMTGVASAEQKMAMYRLDQAGNARQRIVSCRTNTFDCATTGVKTASLDEGTVYIAPGEYALFWVANSTPGLRGIDVNNATGAHMGRRASSSLLMQRSLFADSHAFATALPEPLGITTWLTSSSVEHPMVIFTKV